MSRISRIVVLLTTLASLFGAITATAGGVTWTNHGSTSFTATGGAGTLTSTGVSQACTGSDVSGTAPASAGTNTYTMSGTIGFTNCVCAGSACTLECGYSMTATAVIGTAVDGTLDLTCGFYVANTKLCHIEGSTPAVYSNETGTLQVATSSLLRITGVNCPLGSNHRIHTTALDFRVTSATPPTITRAA